jgi:Zn-dependent peptidase ImmA (M78 family)
MHKSSPINHTDSISSLSWFNDKNKKGIFQQEYEANVFASELLFPTHIFKEYIKNQAFSPDVIREVSDKFNVSRSSVIHRFAESGNHPICVFYTKNNKVHYWRRSEGFNYKIKDITKLAPPTDSVAAEYFSQNIIYPIDDSKQEIIKSTWLDVREDYVDDTFYEFCMVYSSANLAISVIWEE